MGVQAASEVIGREVRSDIFKSLHAFREACNASKESISIIRLIGRIKDVMELGTKNLDRGGRSGHAQLF